LHLHDTPEINGAILFTIPSPNGEPNGKARIGDQINFGSGSAGLGSIHRGSGVNLIVNEGLKRQNPPDYRRVLVYVR
jgi:hypothetical protein